MSEFEQHPLLRAFEAHLLTLAKSGRGPVALVFDARHGWCVTDEVARITSRFGTGNQAYSMQTYGDWYSPNIGEAMLRIWAARFQKEPLVGTILLAQPAAPLDPRSSAAPAHPVVALTEPQDARQQPART